MAPITEKQEYLLDEADSLDIVIDGVTRTIDKRSIYFYGKINFDEDGNDMAIAENMELIPIIDTRGYSIPSRYNYNKHTAIGNEKGPYHYDTIRTDLVLKYKHGCLGKPERVVVWKDTRLYPKTK